MAGQEDLLFGTLNDGGGVDVVGFFELLSRLHGISEPLDPFRPSEQNTYDVRKLHGAINQSLLHAEHIIVGKHTCASATRF